MPAISFKQENALLIVKFTKSQLLDHEAYEIGAELRAMAPKASWSCILVDFEGVEYFSSTMIGQLFMLRNHCKARNITVKICGMSPAVRQAVEIVQLPRVLDVYEDEEAARVALEGEFVVAVEDEARPDIEQLTKDAKSGDADAQYQLGKCRDEGKGVPQSSAEAISWYRKAAEQGHTEGQYMLGNAYAYGIEVEQDYDTALEWYEQAAKQGHVNAEYSLGTSYHYGVGVDKDEVEASTWYTNAAEQGHEPSQTGLARLGKV
jgi:anti-anti-sigma factor